MITPDLLESYHSAKTTVVSINSQDHDEQLYDSIPLGDRVRLRIKNPGYIKIGFLEPMLLIPVNMDDVKAKNNIEVRRGMARMMILRLFSALVWLGLFIQLKLQVAEPLSSAELHTAWIYV